MTTFELGQTVFVAWTPPPVRGRAALPHVTSTTIDKIGRRWATLASGERFDLETRELDGGDYESPGSVWPSVEAHDQHLARLAAWELVRTVARNAPEPPADLEGETLIRFAAALAACRLNAA